MTGKTKSPYDQFSSQTWIISIKSCTIMLHIIYWKSLAETGSFVITAINGEYCPSGATTICFIVYCVIAALCGLCIRSSLRQRMTSASYNEYECFLAGCMPTQQSSRTDRLVGCFLQLRSMTSGRVLRRHRSIHKELTRNQSQLLLD